MEIKMSNDWLELFGMNSIWNDPEFPTDIQKQEQVEKYDMEKQIKELRKKENKYEK